MELRQLEYLVAVAEEANFTRAAQRVHVAQPAVSAQIARLERELGEALFDRTRRAVRLTATGEAVLPHARAALDAVHRLRTAVDELAELVRGSVTVGTVTAHNVDMPQLLADYHRDHPAVDVTLSVDTSEALVDGVRSGRFDVVITAIGTDEALAGLAVATTTDQALVAAVSHDDAWATRRTVALSALARRPLISLPVGAGIRRQFDQACAATGVSPHVAFEAATPEALIDLAARGLGVAIAPESAARGRADIHPIAIWPELRGRLVLAWRSTGPISPAARTLIDMARKFVGADE